MNALLRIRALIAEHALTFAARFVQKSVVSAFVSARIGVVSAREKPRPADTSDFEIFSLFLAKAVR